MSAIGLARRGALLEIDLGGVDPSAWHEGAARRLLAERLTGAERDAEIYGVTVRLGDNPAIPPPPPTPPPPGATAQASAEITRFAWAIDCGPKPIVPLLDRPLRGTLGGLAFFGTHRVAGPGFAWRADDPERGMGLLGGASNVVSRLPPELAGAVALGLVWLDRATALRHGVVIHCSDAEEFDLMCDGIAASDPVDPLLDRRYGPAGGEQPISVPPALAEALVAEDVGRIVALVNDDEAGTAGLAADARVELTRRSPVSAAVSFAAIAGARQTDRRGALLLEHRLMSHWIAARAGGATDDDIHRPIGELDAPGLAGALVAARAMVGGWLAKPPEEALQLPTHVELQPFRRIAW